MLDLTIPDYFSILGVWVTPFTMWSSYAVVLAWYVVTREALAKAGLDRRPIDWMFIGVSVSFAGGFVDNGYWGAAWSTDLGRLPGRDVLFEWGSVPNLPFRQLADTIAAVCHMHGAAISQVRIVRGFAISLAIGTLWVTFLLWMRASA